MEHVIEIKSLKKSFGENHVLKGIDLTIKKGEALAILGRSGIGKSVLTKCIVRLIYPDEGSILVLGEKITELEYNEITELRKKVGYLFQSSALYDSMTVRENLEFPLRRTGIAKNQKEMDERIEEAAESVGLKDALKKMPAELSGGMKKRIGMARTIIKRPEIILYDEPTTGLDPVTSSEISELMNKIREKYNNASIIVTHDLSCARITADSLKLLHNGIFHAEGTFEEFSSSEDPVVKPFFSYK
jgi:phospholipid/cholesterol/gamma-HCH transport system ATP-binding protein